MVRDLILFWLYLEMSKPNQLKRLSTFNLLIHSFSGILHVLMAITRQQTDKANNMMIGFMCNQIRGKNSKSPDSTEKGMTIFGADETLWGS